ncbi:MAG: hypothetical protein Q8M26_08695 [Pseudolabrys sp.]|nr:hypothetical protein [Pseudolabrys sp.]
MLFAFTAYEAKLLLDYRLGKAVDAGPVELFMGLHTASPTKSGSYASELVGGGYARQAIFAAMSAASPSTGTSTNVLTIQTAVATIDLGIVTHISLSDHASLTGATNMRYFGELDTAFIFNIGEAFRLVPGQFQIQYS